MKEKQCLFCLTELEDGVGIFGPVGKAVKAHEIIVKYFWFDLNEDDSAEEFVCYDCWFKVKSFHEFYQNVETLHDRYESEITIIEATEQNFIDKPTTEDGDNQINNLIETDTEYDDYFEIETLDETSSTSDDIAKLDESVSQTEELIGLQIDFMNKDQRIANESQSNTDRESLNDDELGLDLNDDCDELGCHLNMNKKIEILDISIVQNYRKKGRPIKVEPKIDKIECFMCHKSYESFESLRRHFLNHDPEANQLLACHICSRTFSADYELNYHMKRSHRYSKSYQEINCPVCNKRMKYVYLKAHVAEVHENLRRNNQKFICEICGKEFNSVTGLTQHVPIHASAQSTKVQCDICNKWLKNKFVLRSHKLIHDSTQFKCSYCNKIKPNLIALKSHISYAHSVAKHQCLVCNKLFSRPITLKEHMAIHTGQDLYHCKYCTRTFKNSPNMYKHFKDCHPEEWSIDRIKKKNNQL